VCVTTSRNADRLIRRGFRIAHRLKADWHVAYVHVGLSISDETSKRVQALQDLTGRLGGKYETEHANTHKRLPEVILHKAAEYRSTQMIVGQSARGFWQSLLGKSVVKSILRNGRHMDVLVVADYDPNIRIEDN
jgi:two-component system sensor histidine kinase KdpD